MTKIFHPKQKNQISKTCQKIIQIQDLIANTADRTFKEAIPDRWEDFAPMCEIKTAQGLIKFKPYEYQKELIAQIEAHSTIVIAKARQLGITETILNYFLWKAIKYKGYKAAIFSKCQDDTSEFSLRLRVTCNGLNIGANLDSMKKLLIDDGGGIYYRNSKINNARSLAGFSDILYDESAFIEEIDQIYKASAPCVTTAPNPKLIILSTPNGENNWFYDRLAVGNPERDIKQVCEQIKEGKLSPFTWWTDRDGKCKVFLHWKAHPQYSKDENYLYNLQKKTGMNWEAIEQEYNLNFGSSKEIVFSSHLLDRVFRGELHQDYNRKEYNYYAGLDVATVGEDSLVFAILAENKNTGKLDLADYYRNDRGSFIDHLEQITFLLSKYYPLCVAIEITGGEGAIYREALEENLPDYNYYSFKTTSANKQAAIDRLIFYFEQDKMILPRSEAVIREEFKAFKRKGNKLNASSGYHDDTVMALAIALDGIVYYENL